MNISFAPDLDTATGDIESGMYDIISRLPASELLQALAHISLGLFDFDGTLSPGNQWAHIQSRLPSRLRAEEDRDRDWYYDHLPVDQYRSVPLSNPDWFHQGHMLEINRAAVEGAWAARALLRQRDAKLTATDYVRAAEEIELREGVRELLELMQHSVVISFGVEQLIDLCLKYHGLTAAVAANRLTFDEHNVVNGHDPNVVVSATKAAARDRFCQLAGLEDRRCLLGIGDTVVDLDMMDPNGFNVLIMPPTEANKKLAGFRQNHLEPMWDRLTMILVSDSLMPLVELIRQARTESLTP